MEAVIRKQTSFRLREDLLQLLQEHAKKANRSLNNFVESTLMDAMYTEPNAETIAAIEEARSGKSAGTVDTSNFEAFMKSENEVISVMFFLSYHRFHLAINEAYC